MLFKVSRQYQRGGESYFAQFADRHDAEQFIDMKRDADRMLRVAVIYRLYQGAVLLQAYGEEGGGDAGESSPARGGRDTGATFSPTPFNATPRPSGFPPNWLKENDSEDDKE